MTPTSRPDSDDRQETLDLARQLIACPSITPDDGGCLGIMEARLSGAGFTCERLDRNGVRNLWARFGTDGPVVCFAGHVDVVPPGPIGEWKSPPFAPSERDGFLYGRGASDMKGPLAAMIVAAERVAASRPPRGSIALLLTSDEEGDAIDGTAAVVEVLRARGDVIDACVVGEPTSEHTFGDTIKNGRRGSLSGDVRIAGIQCHIAYPERGHNPIPRALGALLELTATVWDRGNASFQPTSFQISNMHAGTGAVNVIPGALDVSFNLRFSPETTDEALRARVRDVFDRHGLDYALTWRPVAQPFLTADGPLAGIVARAVGEIAGRMPMLSTGGGTSDGRFIATIAREIVEFGPVNDTIHKVNERICIDDLDRLVRVYERVLAARLDAGT